MHSMATEELEATLHSEAKRMKAVSFSVTCPIVFFIFSSRLGRAISPRHCWSMLHTR
jgi:hypothetical protein